MAKVSFHYLHRKLAVKNKKNIKAFIEQQLFETEKVTLNTLRYVFCSDEYLLTINNQFLSHDDYTDIITFDLSDDQMHGIIGEVYISLDRVKENALLLNNKFTEELLRVIFHGALHLCGYKDKKQSESKLMREKENFYIHLFKKSST